MPDERFSSHLPAVFATTTATLIATFGLSYLGFAGTLAGLAGGSLITGTGSWWFERWYRKTAAVARAKRAAALSKGRPLTDGETQVIERVQGDYHARRHRFSWRVAGMSAGAALVVVVAVVVVVELGAGKPVSALVQGRPAHGLLVPEPAATATVTPAPSPHVTVTATPSQTLPTSAPAVTPPAPATSPPPPPSPTTPPPSPAASTAASASAASTG